MKHLKVIFVAFLIGITIFTVYMYIASLQEKYGMVAALEKMKAEVVSLKDENQTLLVSLGSEKALNNSLTAENAGLKENLKASEEKLAKLGEEFQAALKDIEDLNNEVVALKAENVSLANQKETLTLQVAQTAQEKKDLEEKMSSIVELKQMIRDLKKHVRKTNKEVKTLVKIEKVKAAQLREMIGNGGYIIKDGKPTFYPRIKIQVEPISQ
jgi:chromosome segregation ATPase